MSTARHSLSRRSTLIGMPTSFATSAVKNHTNASVISETLLQRLVHQRNTPRMIKRCLLFISNRAFITSPILRLHTKAG